jgi:hypothetical protein
MQNYWIWSYYGKTMATQDHEVEDIVTLAERYRLVVHRSNRAHYIAAERAERRGRILGAISVLLGAVVGTSIFATIQLSPSVNWRIATGLVATLAAVLSAIHTFLDYAKQATGNRSAGAAYGCLRRDFDGFFIEARTLSDRVQLMERLSVLRQRIDELGQASPLIPGRAYKAALKQIDEEAAANKPETQHQLESPH